MVAFEGIPPERKAVGPRRTFICLAMASLIILPRIGLGQSAVVSGSPGILASVKFQILDQQTVSFGQHSLTLNRVAPPVFPASTPAPSPPAMTALPYTNYQMLVFSATVYDHRFTVLQWIDGDNKSTAVTNINFNSFCYTNGFAKGDTYYEIIAFLDDESATEADPTTAQWLAEAKQALKPGTPGYLMVSGTGTPDEIQALNALHAYYAANSDAMIQTYTERQAQWAAQLLQWKLHPPVRPNTVINYWPIKSSVYPTGSGQ
jgi:hypothetical protein